MPASRSGLPTIAITSSRVFPFSLACRSSCVGRSAGFCCGGGDLPPAGVDFDGGDSPGPGVGFDASLHPVRMAKPSTATGHTTLSIPSLHSLRVGPRVIGRSHKPTCEPGTDLHRLAEQLAHLPGSQLA